jgi:hypothetical protein
MRFLTIKNLIFLRKNKQKCKYFRQPFSLATNLSL